MFSTCQPALANSSEKSPAASSSLAMPLAQLVCVPDVARNLLRFSSWRWSSVSAGMCGSWARNSLRPSEAPRQNSSAPSIRQYSIGASIGLSCWQQASIWCPFGCGTSGPKG